MGEIYTMEPVQQSEHLDAYDIDILVVSADAGCRTYKGARELYTSGHKIGELCVLKFESQVVERGNQLYDAYMDYKAIGIPVREIDLPEDNLIFDYSLFSNKRILVDITGFSIPCLFRFLFVLREFSHIHDLHVIYTEPMHYLFGKDTYGSYQYYLGEREYRALEEFYVSGEDSKEVLAIFLGFDRMTSSVVRDAVDPTETVIINGFPALTPKLKDVSLLNNRELISLLGKPSYSVKTNNPFAAYNVLESIQHSHQNTLINACVLGTKAMALGVGVYALLHNNVKLSYAYTKQHAALTSDGADTTWYYYFSI